MGRNYSGEWLGIENFGVVAMAVHALDGSVLINHDGLICEQFGLNVTLGARDVGVAPGQGKMSAGIMIEGGGHPSLGIVAIYAMGLAILGEKLGIVGVIVAGFA